MAKKNTTETALQKAQVHEQLPDHLREYQDEGFENAVLTDYVIPLAALMQSQSPLVLEDGSDIVAGDIIDSVDHTLLVAGKADHPLSRARIIIILYKHPYIEWTPREEGGGIVAISDDRNGELARRCARNERRADGKQAVTEYQSFICLFPDSGDDWLTRPRLLSFSRTNYKNGKQLLTLARQRGGGKAPIYSGYYELYTKTESNSKGKYKVIKVEPGGWVEPELIEHVRAKHLEFKQLDKDKGLTVADEGVNADIEEDENDEGF